MAGSYFRLEDNYFLRGWDKLPYAVIDRQTNAPTFVSRDIMSALLLCDGEHDADSILVSSARRADIDRLVERGWVVPCREDEAITEEQRYLCYPNRYVSHVQWSVTGRCNFRCRHCMMSAPEAALGELSHEAALNIVDQLAECGILRVALTGGELFVRKDVPDLIEALVEKGAIISQIYTNGALLNEGVLDLLERLGQRPEVVMSFDGVGHHDWLRGVEGAEDMAYRALELCVERGLITKVQMTLHRNNVSSLRETVRRIGEMGCTAMRVNPATDMGDWVVNGQGLTLTREELYEAELAYIPHYFEDGMPIALILSGLVGLSPETPDRYEVLPYKGGDHDEDRYLLTCARNSIQLSADGYPSICELARPLRDSSLVGLVPIVSDDPSVSCTPLAEVLSGDSPFMRSLYLKESDLVQHGGACSTCPYLSACRGGCRAEAFRETGDVLGVSPGACAFFKDGRARRLIATMREVWPGATSAILDDSLFADAASDA